VSRKLKAPLLDLEQTPSFMARRGMLCVVLGLTTPLCGSGAGFELRVIISEPNSTTQQTIKLLTKRFPKIQIESNLRTLLHTGPTVYVALGSTALQAALEVNLRAPLLALYVSNEQYRSLNALHRTAQGRALVTAIFTESSPRHQMQLIQAIFSRELVVGVMLSENTAHLETSLQQAAQAHHLQLEIQRFEQGANVVRTIGRFNTTDVLLAVPDRQIFAAETLRNLLESTYRRRQPVIGFSAALVRAGALASAYASIEDTTAQAIQVIEQLMEGKIPLAQYPMYWRVVVNDSVARSLNIPIDDAVRKLGNPSR
jgi:putative tryptophan/tyrosine transport system substrate-binding protein